MRSGSTGTGHVWTNMWLGGEARQADVRSSIIHTDFSIRGSSVARGGRSGLLTGSSRTTTAHVRWWRALSSKEADQIRAVVGSRQRSRSFRNGIDLGSGQFSVGIWQFGRHCRSLFAQGLSRPASVHVTGHFAWTTRKRPKRLLFLSRLHPKKGLDLLVPAWGRLVGEFTDWELLIVGPDEGGYRAKVEKMMADSGCDDACRICGPVSGAEKHALLRTADLFVLPSYSEGFPMAVLEAAAHRIPVVQTTECNFPELTAAVGALECVPESGALEQALRQALAADDGERQERGTTGRALVEKDYSWGHIAGRVLEICRG